MSGKTLSDLRSNLQSCLRCSELIKQHLAKRSQPTDAQICERLTREYQKTYRRNLTPARS